MGGEVRGDGVLFRPGNTGLTAISASNSKRENLRRSPPELMKLLKRSALRPFHRSFLRAKNIFY